MTIPPTENSISAALVSTRLPLFNGKMLAMLLILVLEMCGAVADAQQAGKVPRIGFLDGRTASGSAVLVDAFRQELSKLGWVEGKSITIEYRFAEQKRERVPELAADLVRLKIDLIVASGTPTALAAKKATTTMPIVMTNVGDPVAFGLVASLARPGGNVTGNASLAPAKYQKARDKDFSIQRSGFYRRGYEIQRTVARTKPSKVSRI